MSVLLRRRDFAIFWLADVISVIGDWMLMIGLPIYVYVLSQSTLATSIMFMVNVLPKLALGSLGGVFADRWDRRRLMIGANLLQALCLLPLLFVHSVGSLWIVYVASFASSVIAQFFIPAANAFLPTLVNEDELTAANSMNALSNNLSRLIGPPLGGIIAGWFGLTGLIWSDLVSFLLAAILIALIATRPGQRVKPALSEQRVNPWLKVGREWAEGMRLIWREHNVFVVLVLFGISSVGEGVISTLFAPFVSKAFHGGAAEMGWMMGSQAIGGLLGGLGVGWVASRIVPTRLLGICAFVFGCIDLIIFNYPAFFSGLLIPLGLFVLVGIPTAGMFSGYMTIIQTGTPDEYRGRVFGALFALGGLMTLIGASVAGLLGDRLGPVLLLNIQGGGYVLAGVLAWFWLRHEHKANSPAASEATAEPISVS
ncbi:MAG: MFS transporter [Ktedonobacteraceae bacterium]|nr:MFS transporter [Ktedonobacteraceae bacterium]